MHVQAQIILSNMRDKLIHQSTLYFDDAVVHDPPRLVNQVGYFSKP